MRNFFLERFRNYKRHLANMTMAAAAAAGMTACSAQATSIAIANPDFEIENHIFSNYNWFEGGVEGWSGLTGPGGTSAFGGSNGAIPLGYAHTGSGSLYTNGGYTGFQTLSSNWAAGTYAFTYWSGGTSGSPTSTVTLSDPISLTTVGTSTVTVGSPLATSYQLNTLSFTVLAGNPVIGNPIKIRLDGTGPVFYDDVALDFVVASVPEPRTISLIGSGAAGLIVTARRRRAKA